MWATTHVPQALHALWLPAKRATDRYARTRCPARASRPNPAHQKMALLLERPAIELELDRPELVGALDALRQASCDSARLLTLGAAEVVRRAASVASLGRRPSLLAPPPPAPAGDAAATVRAACAAVPALRAALGLPPGGTGGAGPLALAPLSGGLSNHVFLVTGPSGARVVVKHGLDHHLLVTDMPFDLSRLATEAACLRACAALAPGAAPRLVHLDASAGIIATEFLEARETLSDALRRGAILPGTGARLGAALARVAAGTAAGGALAPELRSELERALAASTQISDLMFRIVNSAFDPSAQHDAAWPAALGPEVRRLVLDCPEVQSEAAALAALWRHPPPGQRVLAHTDLWLGNILVGGPRGGATDAIDFEFGTWAPAAFDIGHVLGQFALAALLVRALAEAEAEEAGAEAAAGAAPVAGRVAPEARAAQEAWLLGEIPATWDAYAAGRGRRSRT